MPATLALAGGSLVRFERYQLAATTLGVLAGIMQVFALLAYLSDGHRFYSSVWMPTPLTAVGLLCVVIAIVLRTAMPALRRPRPNLLIMLGCDNIAPLLPFGLYTGIRITDAQLREVRHEPSICRRELTVRSSARSRDSRQPSFRQGDFAEFQRQAEVWLALQQRGNIVLIERKCSNSLIPSCLSASLCQKRLSLNL